jgi:hypothetical protein
MSDVTRVVAGIGEVRQPLEEAISRRARAPAALEEGDHAVAAPELRMAPGERSLVEAMPDRVEAEAIAVPMHDAGDAARLAGENGHDLALGAHAALRIAAADDAVLDQVAVRRIGTVLGPDEDVGAALERSYEPGAAPLHGERAAARPGAMLPAPPPLAVAAEPAAGAASISTHGGTPRSGRRNTKKRGRSPRFSRASIRIAANWIDRRPPGRAAAD